MLWLVFYYTTDMKHTSLTQAFWDYNYSEREIEAKLNMGTREEKVWVVRRILENLPYEAIWKYITLSQLKEHFKDLRLRPQLKNIWEYTLALWDKYDKEKSAH